MSEQAVSFRWLRWMGLGLAGITLSASGSWLTLTPELPDISILKEVRYETPLQVLTREGKVISEFGVKHTVPLTYAQIPKTLVNAFLAAEDDQFFQHDGIDYSSLGRAFGELVTSGSIRSGGSTITMQLAKNYFLTNARTFNRKFTEILLAKRIEDSLTKQEILELYLNKIYLGQRAYGIGAAAKIYYGKPVAQLTVAEMAMIAGLPKAPSRYNPVANPDRAMVRRNWIIGRMLKLGFINKADHDKALKAPVGLNYKSSLQDVSAPYLAEMVREALLERFGEKVYDSGYKVYTTVGVSNQDAANNAVINGLLAYDRRHGWRGAEARVDTTPLNTLSRIGTLEPAVVSAVAKQSATVELRSGERVVLNWDAMRWARRYIDTNRYSNLPTTASQILKVGDIIRLQPNGKSWTLAQIPQVQGQLIALNPETGAIEALVGGFDYSRSKFNRSIQGRRQAGSIIKPFIYAKALERGYTPASLIDDAPLDFDGWQPSNSDGKFMGPITLRRALYLSRNLVSIRLLQAVGVSSARNYISRFGIDPKHMPNNLTLALGTGEVLPVQMATAFAAIANGGLRINPYFIEKVVDRSGKIVFEANPRRVCRECEIPTAIVASALETSGAAENEDGTTVIPAEADDSSEAPINSELQIGGLSTTPAADKNPALRIMRPRAAWQMYNIMQDVIVRGTGRAALSLGRSDLAGKTGTTDEAKDAWFAGFNGKMVAVSWVGFDKPASLGRSEYGGVAALPIWREYMATALRGMPMSLPPAPPGLTAITIDRTTGQRTVDDDPNAVKEWFTDERVPAIPELIPVPVDPASAEGATEGGISGAIKRLLNSVP
ncbi:MAG: penicillin-binding protein 1A [Paraperlucidibaca sp.]|jgi:penicillin-binding protein 1A|tara:strand:- start:7924 stop:10422 length:2499 start_codon:yes stop_codon:yes gene_type:complete